jgi:hypothetical protein
MPGKRAGHFLLVDILWTDRIDITDMNIYLCERYGRFGVNDLSALVISISITGASLFLERKYTREKRLGATWG